MDINGKPLETCVRRVQITYCEDAHICTKEQACLEESRSIVWFGVNFPFAMHPFNVGKWCVHTLIKYAQRWDVFICEFIDAMKLAKVELH